MSLIKLNLGEESSRALGQYVENIGITPSRNFHSTIIYTEEIPVFKREDILEEIKRRLPITLDPRTYQLDLFGNRNILALRYSNPNVKDIYDLLMSFAIKQQLTEWPNLIEEEIRILEESLKKRRKGKVYTEFSPHITLSKNSKKDYEKFCPPTFPINLESLEWIVE